jgi:hypothetical protein
MKLHFSKKIFFVLFLITHFSVNGQKYLLPNETVIFSFNTQNGKIVTVNKDKENKYIIYRYGTKDNVEFEFPNKSKSSWTNFKYSSYLRGGGIQNEGMDLNYLSFVNEKFKYVIYDTYYARGNNQNVGIKIIDLKSNKVTNIKGLVKTRKGTLVDFRDNELVETGEELYE